MTNIDSILKILVPIAASLATWLAARYARKVVVQVNNQEIRIEAATVRDAQKMLKAIEDFQRSRPTNIDAATKDDRGASW